MEEKNATDECKDTKGVMIDLVQVSTYYDKIAKKSY